MSVKDRLWLTHKGTCFYCGCYHQLDEASVDHFIPTSHGGPNSDLNRVLACIPCNGAKGNLNPRDYGLPYPTPCTPEQAFTLLVLKAAIAHHKNKPGKLSPPMPQPFEVHTACAAASTPIPLSNEGAMTEKGAPDFKVLHIEEPANGAPPQVCELGFATQAADGIGYYLMLRAVPLGGRLYLQPQRQAQKKD